jgi:hypothetical protein
MRRQRRAGMALAAANCHTLHTMRIGMEQGKYHLGDKYMPQPGLMRTRRTYI